MKNLKSYFSKEKLKFILTFGAGGLSCLFVVIAISAFSTSYANTVSYKNATKVNYSMYVNGSKANIDSYNIDGRTYVSLSELSNYTHLYANWVEEERAVRISDSSHLVLKDIDGKKHIDMTYWMRRYADNQPERILPYVISHNHIETPNKEIIGIPMKNTGLYEWSLDFDYFKEHVFPILPEIISTNEKALSEIKN